MNEQLQQALAALLTTTVNGIEAGTAFLQAELPEVIQQLLMWKFAMSALSMLSCLALAFAIYRFNRWQLRHWTKVLADDEFYDHPEMLFNVVQIFWVFPLLGLWSLDWLQIWLAPKIYLIEYAAQLAK